MLTENHARNRHAPLDGAAAAAVDLRAGALQVRLAAGADDIEAAQALRYRIFYQEMGAHPTVETALLRRDADDFDAVADHLLVVDHDRRAIVGTYRLIRREAALRRGRFYTAAEYDIACIEAHPGEILELGRSCVDAAARNRATMQLLWRGIAAYVFHYNIELMFGCASLPGTDATKLAVPLSYLHHFHLAPPPLRVRALSDRHVELNRLPREAFDPAVALGQLPPLVKGYLRLGGFVGDGAVVDRQFNTTDVCVLVKTDLVTQKYYRHYERRAREDVVA
ncbi:MAG TPA: GNAT family N-acyltransferase [Stellaceae bacterium]|nr:GNAT family N-acyltransferase [Stellaceae bacterium]